MQKKAMVWGDVLGKHLQIILCLIFIISITLTSCSSLNSQETTSGLDPVSLHLSWHHGTQFLGFYIAQSRGFYAEEGLLVKIEAADDPTEIEQSVVQVVSGEIDFEITGVANLVDHNELPFATIATIYQFSPATFFYYADLDITTPKDLVSHSIVVKNAGWEKVLIAFLETADLTMNDVDIVSGGFDLTPFYEREVDVWAGFITNEVVRARQRGLEINTFPLYEYGIYQQDNIIITSQEKMSSNLEQVVGFLRASLHGWEWAVENPEDAVDIMLELFPELAPERDFYIDSFLASIPLILPGGSQIGDLDCSLLLFPNVELAADICSNDVLNLVREE